MAFDKFRRVGHGDDDRVHALMREQVALQAIFAETSGDPFLPHDDVAKVRACIDNILYLYSLLANSAVARGVLIWNVVPKFHFLWHLGQKAQYSHPRKGNTMVDEDYVGLIKTVVHSCVLGE